MDWFTVFWSWSWSIAKDVSNFHVVRLRRYTITEPQPSRRLAKEI